MIQKLPEKFENKMRELLGDEFQAFLDGFKDERYGGVRFNRMKTDKEKFLEKIPFKTEEVAWIDNGFYYDLSDTPSKDPYYYAGLYYIQEPSAMTPANMLPINPGDKVLDICAAPGGKSTELSAKLNGTGVLVSNDISASRAKALLKNLEVFGSKNALIMSEAPSKMTEKFRGYFDKILIDAPCSGEGMFRKSPAIMKNWEQYGVEYYHKLQLEILEAVLPMLAPGGMLLYSTCTFDPSEDEGSLQWILENYPDFHVVKSDLTYEGFDHGHPEYIGSDKKEIENAIRLWPHRLKGEGHFSALLQRDDGEKTGLVPYRKKSDKIPACVAEFFKHVKMDIPSDRLELRGEYLCLVPKGIPDISGLRIMRTGLLLGEVRKDRFEPSQALAMALKAIEYDNVYSLSHDDEDVIKYLKCETIEARYDVPDGWVLVCVDDLPLGWAKAQRNTLKNKLLPGWRMM